MRFKFVSSGQNEADALVVNQTLLGNALQPLPPANLRGDRNSVNDLFAQWTRRSRGVAGLRPGTDVPVNEEAEIYKLEIYSGSTLKRTINDIRPATPMRAVLQSIGLSSKFLHITGGNSFSYSSGSSGFSRSAEALQRIPATNNFVEATLIATGDAEVRFGIWPASRDVFLGPTAESLFEAVLYASDLMLYDRTGSPGPIYTESATSYAATGVRIRLELSGSRVLFYKNWAGPGTPPLAESSSAIIYPLRVWSAITYVTSGTGQTNKVIITIAPNVGAVYTAEEQTLDFGSTQSSIKVRAYSRSGVAGFGSHTEATI